MCIWGELALGIYFEFKGESGRTNLGWGELALGIYFEFKGESG